MVPARPAAAHAIVLGSSPADRSSVPVAPSEVRISFSEAVNPSLGGLQVLDADGNRVDVGSGDQPTPEVLRVSLRTDIEPGTYIANYRVISADGHPIAGAIVFGYGVNVDEARASGVASTTDTTWEAIGAVARFVCYLGALTAAGAAFFLAFVGDGATGTAAAGRWVRRAAVVGAAGAAATVVAQAALASGRGVTALTDASVLRPALTGGLGWQTAALLVGLAAVVLVPLLRGIAADAVALYGGLVVAGSYAFWGHATEAEQSWISIGADVVHVAVAAVWAGGVLALFVLLRARLADRRHPADGDYDEAPILASARLVVGFSTAALVSVTLLWLAGGAMAWQTVGSPGALLDSGYGRALAIKLGLVVVLMAMAAYNRFRLVPAIIDDAEPPTPASGAEPVPGSLPGPSSDPDAGDPAIGAPGPEAEDDESDGDDAEDGEDGPLGPPLSASPEPAWRRLVTTLRLEAAGIVAVLLVTGALVNLTPPKFAEPAADRPFDQTVPLRSAQLNLVVSPATTGTNALHLSYYGADGKPADIVRKVTVSFTLPSKQIGPIVREGRKAGPGHFLLENVTDFVVAGTWTISVESRTGEFDVEKTDLQVLIRKA